MRLKPDARLRKMWFTEEAMSHPAKGHLGLWWEILERYTHPGQLVLDPMSGIGSSLIAAMMGRNVICNEMETHFLEPMAASWAKMQQHGPMLGHQMGQALIIRGDARMLPIASADAIVTSPPYEGTISSENNGIDWAKVKPDYAGRQNHAERVKAANERHIESYTRPVDSIITSPPYEGISPEARSSSIDPVKNYESYRRAGGGASFEKWSATRDRHSKGYTRVDAVVTSPPYEGSIQGEPGIDWTDVRSDARRPHRDYTAEPSYPTKIASFSGYSQVNSANIGNLRGNAYWQSMEQVYRECHRVLIPGGVMVLVLKGYSRAGRYVDLPQQTADCIEGLGFAVFDRWTREVPLSFWRTLQKQRGNWDDNLRFEHVIATRKVIPESTSK